MSRTDRLFQLMQALRDLPPPATAQALARETGVSERTIYRDIDSLRGLGAVIDGEAGFGFTLIEDATLPPLGFVPEEIEALVVGLNEVMEVGDPALASAAHSALNKLKSRLPEAQAHRLKHAILTARRFEKPPAPGIDASVLRQAAWEERTVGFDYADAQGAQTSRQADPLSIVFMKTAHCLLAYCHLRKDFRAFRLDRMSDLAVTERSFRPRRIPMLREFKQRLREENQTSANPRA
ncbi:YafY family transcriptional regulator [Shimia sp. R9_1]|uniref:helix-turn-helix transcriptional regulator n=1 Tax=Shimia sp. R9_2 TaxID=2821112 RepID=UPI001ADAB82E|nr:MULTISPECIES: YafY family protein [unclassified Shimia]MBO9395388.1 YafY family transcriptional regulator [Shimia sp. R9_2]MBO9407392.1 YafY family transcriptional regulator [Shimia sp. R9_1]